MWLNSEMVNQLSVPPAYSLFVANNDNWSLSLVVTYSPFSLCSFGATIVSETHAIVVQHLYMQHFLVDTKKLYVED